jgi:hypothetical protein
MKRTVITKTFLLLLSAAFLVAGCNEEDSPFSGYDNYIVAFTLVKDGVTLKGAVSSDEIVVTADEQFSLSEAKANVVLSENAAIAPDPATISDWNVNQSFTVTAYAGSKRTYVYRVERQLVAFDGNVVLQTQSDVDRFAADLKTKGIDQINGDIIVANEYRPDDSITSLAGVERLKIVTGNILIGSFFGGDLTAFEMLEKVNGLSASSEQIRHIRFPKLSAVFADLLIDFRAYERYALCETIEFPELTFVNNTLRVYGAESTASLSFPKLQQVLYAVEINGRTAEGKLRSIEFPELIVAPRLYATGMYNLERLLVPKLESTIVLNIINENSSTQIDLRSLKTISNNFNVSGPSEIAFPALETVAATMSFTISSESLTSLHFPALKSVNSLQITRPPNLRLTTQSFPVLQYVKDLSIELLDSFTSLDVFGSIDSVGSFSLSNLKNLTSLSGLSSIKKIGRLVILLPTIKEVDLRGIAIDELLIALQSQTEKLTLIGDDDFSGSLGIYNPPSNATELPLTVQAGFKTVDGFMVTTGYSASSSITELEFPWLERVRGLLHLSECASVKRFSFPNLQEAGAIQTTSYYLSSLETLEIPRLEKITGYVAPNTEVDLGMMFPLSSSNITSIEAPRLKSVVGGLSITGLTAVRKLQTLSFPRLESLTGTLTLSGTGNTTFVDLSGFGALTSVGGVVLSGFTLLYDFEALKNVVSALSADAWVVTGCGYNPAYQDMLDGKYARP